MNTDGVALFSSSKKGNMWPIYVAINELPIKQRFSKKFILTALLYCKSEKPNMLTYMAPLMDTLKRLSEEGIEVLTANGKCLVRVHLLAVTLDLPARAMVANTKQFNGKFGCSSCLDEGAGRPDCPMHRYWPYHAECELRTHQSWLDDARRAVATTEALALLNRRLLMIQTPYFVSRRQRNLEEFTHWKATECREWLLHYSVPVLKGVLKPVALVHYTLLVTAMDLMNRELILLEDIGSADKLLNDFCKLYPQLYGDFQQTMNVHLLKHIPHMVRLHGPLFASSCFGFETMNAHLKSMVHGTRFTNNQVSFAVRMAKALPKLVKQFKDDPDLDPSIKSLTQCLSSKLSLGEDKCEAEEQQILGKVFQPTVDLKRLLQQHGVADTMTVYKFYRLKRDYTTFYSEEYQRVTTRNSYTVEMDSGSCGIVKYFVSAGNVLFALVEPLEAVTLVFDNEVETNDILHKYENNLCRHIKKVLAVNELKLFNVSSFKRKCVYMKFGNDSTYISIPPNLLEHH